MEYSHITGIENNKYYLLCEGALISQFFQPFWLRSQAEMAHNCRGSIRLQGAMIHTEDTCHFVISNAGTNTFHLRAGTEVERQRWVTALELAKTKAVKVSDSGNCWHFSLKTIVFSLFVCWSLYRVHE